MDIQTVIRALDEALPDTARNVIASHLDQTDPFNRSFLASPDGREQHQVNWHRWGIITHTRVFLRLFDVEVPRYLREWGLLDRASTLLYAPIDGIARWDLLHISILLHDIGKFAARTHSSTGFHFARHERLSGQIIRNELHLDRYGLTPAQTGYVALTAEDHFVLGLLRRKAREQGAYSVEFVRSESFARLAREVIERYKDDFIEIGVLFLGDSLAKIDPAEGPERALGQHPINVELSRRYLEIALANRSI